MRIIDNESSDSECFEVPNGLRSRVVEIIEDCVVHDREVLPELLAECGDKVEKTTTFLDESWGACAENVYPGKGELWYIFEEKFNAKVSKRGNYLVHPGVTVISSAKNHESYRELHAYLCNKVGEFYAILPLESFHVTIHNMFTKMMMKDYYDMLFTKVYPICKKWNESRGERTFRAKPNNAYFRNTIGVMVDLETTGHDLVLEAHNMVRNDAGMKDDGLQFHMTFGYRYNKKEMPESLVKEVVQRIGEAFVDNPIVLGEPTVCTFESMMEFDPL
jgi:hypothetical protein